MAQCNYNCIHRFDGVFEHRSSDLRHKSPETPCRKSSRKDEIINKWILEETKGGVHSRLIPACPQQCSHHSPQTSSQVGPPPLSLHGPALPCKAPDTIRLEKLKVANVPPVRGTGPSFMPNLLEATKGTETQNKPARAPLTRRTRAASACLLYMLLTLKTGELLDLCCQPTRSRRACGDFEEDPVLILSKSAGASRWRDRDPLTLSMAIWPVESAAVGWDLGLSAGLPQKP